MARNHVLSDYMAGVMAVAVYDKLEDSTYAGKIPSCPGVVAFAATLRECEDELRATLEDWILVGLCMRRPLPVIAGIDLNREPARDVGAADSGPTRRQLEILGWYRYILSAPPGLKTKRVREYAKEIGKTQKTIWTHLKKIAGGETTDEGLPLMRRSGVPLGRRSSLDPWMQQLIKDASRSPSVTAAQCFHLIRESMLSHGSEQPLPSRDAVRHFLLRVVRRATTTRRA